MTEMDPPVELVRNKDGLLVSRRRLLQRGGLVGLATAAAPVLVACGGKDGTGAASGDFGTPTGFPRERWNPNAPAGTKPQLEKRFAYVTPASGEGTADFVKHMERALDGTGIEFMMSNSNGDVTKNIQQIRQLIDRGVAGVLVQDLDIASQLEADKYGMDKGVAMFQFNAGPTTCIISSLQYEEGYTQAAFVAEHVKEKLGGKAQICYLNNDANASLISRHSGFRDALRDAGMLDLLVADVTANPDKTQVGFSVMNSVLQQHPDVNVVVGSDDTVIGALAALRAAGKASNPDLFLVGANGIAQALDLVKTGTSAFRATTCVSIPMVGYGPAKFTQLWLEGKTIPQFLVFNNVVIDSPASAAKFIADSQDPVKVFDEMVKGDDTYCQPLGNISYEMHNAYYNGTVPDKLPKAA